MRWSSSCIERVQDDGKYQSFVVTPALLAAGSSSGGITRLIPDFKKRFTRAMLHVRNELVVDVPNNTVGCSRIIDHGLPKC